MPQRYSDARDARSLECRRATARRCVRSSRFDLSRRVSKRKCRPRAVDSVYYSQKMGELTGRVRMLLETGNDLTRLNAEANFARYYLTAASACILRRVRTCRKSFPFSHDQGFTCV